MKEDAVLSKRNEHVPVQSNEKLDAPYATLFLLMPTVGAESPPIKVSVSLTYRCRNIGNIINISR